MRQIKTLADLDPAIALWESDAPDEGKPIGYILSLEGADSIRSVGRLEQAWERGLRALARPTTGCAATRWRVIRWAVLPANGRELIQEIDRLGMILDVTHLLRRLLLGRAGRLPGHAVGKPLEPPSPGRQMCVRSSRPEQLKAIIERGGVIGAALDAWMMIPGWVRGQTTPESSRLKLEVIVDHIDHVCQLAGNARHAGIGTDLDGGYGTEQTPQDLDTITDVARISGMLARHGYSTTDIASIMSGNYIRLIRSAWSSLT